jgi:hypothetical protein
MFFIFKQCLHTLQRIFIVYPTSYDMDILALISHMKVLIECTMFIMTVSLIDKISRM